MCLEQLQYEASFKPHKNFSRKALFYLHFQTSVLRPEGFCSSLEIMYLVRRWSWDWMQPVWNPELAGVFHHCQSFLKCGPWTCRISIAVLEMQILRPSQPYWIRNTWKGPVLCVLTSSSADTSAASSLRTTTLYYITLPFLKHLWHTHIVLDLGYRCLLNS